MANLETAHTPAEYDVKVPAPQDAAAVTKKVEGALKKWSKRRAAKD